MVIINGANQSGCELSRLNIAVRTPGQFANIRKPDLVPDPTLFLPSTCGDLNIFFTAEWPRAKMGYPGGAGDKGSPTASARATTKKQGQAYFTS
jgi:hypothetical protein